MSSQNNNTNRRDSKLWNKDGVNGGLSSIIILVLWLSEEANYRRWKGSNAGQGIKDSLEENEMPEEEVASTMRETMIRKFQYFYDLEPVMSDRPSVIPPFPISSNEEADVKSAFSLDTFDTFDDEEVLMNGRQEISKSSSFAQRRLFSAISHAASNRPGKKVCKTIDAGIVDIVRMAEEMQREKVQQFWQNLAAEEVFQKTQLVLDERRVAVEEMRALTERIRADSESAQH
ncbi:hypothetical protein PHYBLDRAFT_64574 [Phycomyces blakesleeanus NRRL 1555(-)]|uniref:Uncharacterized protein n=1 Tax=Phycomyces blakesleeanus (strain ATCC 8743b / DSM 1359 / FGSC 10004 / NBRC 33097 / NRRL 1555) TaxID=763407 RepID=A0A162PSW6_PHYB8|nr:hypothetical protein PHYBLDRAFT_64574 [Phycomyces blakesleeanus NRRL 1555(-)]OAD75667.1 hypothetical protein PHYBLDRAFT_64574 [Phycomyces blakesleeanus NRRL 1555(-)]|eukprot:XP_018293707.1 hypothetical protein PHYBLDRAFT_64574 [Phycomyces blakesleeanus NRRL 1555(-)]